jgi:U3 small nucleolar ribonucleoprotein protein LCP5
MLTKLQSNQVDTTEHGLSYLELKYNLLASYCQFLSVFILLKLEGGTSLATHPVVDRLLYLKTLLERLRPLDQKLQYQVDKLLRTAALAESGVALDAAAPGKEDGMLYKANIENMVDKDDESEEESEESEEGVQEDESEIEEDSEDSEAGKKKAKDAKKPEVFKAAK